MNETPVSNAAIDTCVEKRTPLIPRDFLGWLLFSFVLGSLTLTGAGQLRAIGLLLAGCYTLYFLKNKLSVPKEIVLYVTWALWAGLTGYLVSIDKGLFLGTFKVVFQNIIMSFAILGITASRTSLNTNFLAVAIGGIFLFLSSVTSGELFLAISGNLPVGVSGLSANQNDFGYNLVLCSAALLYFWKNAGSLNKRIIIIILLSVFLLGITFSASRKAFGGFVLLFLLWAFMCYGKEILKKRAMLLAIMVLLGLLYMATDYMLTNTYMGKRFKGTHIDATEGMSFAEREEKRISFYKQGLDLIIQNPVFGIGLGNFKIYSYYEKESHSEYIEVLTSTGLIGFFLYFFIYLLSWRRLKRIQKRIQDPLILYNIKLLQVIVIVILVLGVGRPNFTSQLIWVVLSSIIGYTWKLEQRISS